jgi:hypothetical protein
MQGRSTWGNSGATTWTTAFALPVPAVKLPRSSELERDVIDRICGSQPLSDPYDQVIELMERHVAVLAIFGPLLPLIDVPMDDRLAQAALDFVQLLDPPTANITQLM